MQTIKVKNLNFIDQHYLEKHCIYATKHNGSSNETSPMYDHAPNIFNNK